jgi:hypothetical protein
MTMTEYRCYFSPKPFDNDNQRSETNTIHILRLDSDEAARLTAEAICDGCDHIRGFEIWQGDRFVYRGGGGNMGAEREPLQVTALSA